MVDEPGVTRDRLYGRAFWGEYEFMVVDTGGVLTLSNSQANVMEELAITTTIGMDGIPLASREAAVARMPSMIERQATAAVEESSVIIFLVDGQVGYFLLFFSSSEYIVVLLCSFLFILSTYDPESKIFFFYSYGYIIICYVLFYSPMSN